MIKFHREIQDIAAADIKPNSFNSNEVDENVQSKITDDIRQNGFYGAIVVRPIGGGVNFEIVDGEHRFRALVALGALEIPCVVVEQDTGSAMINSIRLNTERGNQNPQKVGRIAKTLEELSGINSSDLSRLLVYDQPLIDDMKALTTLPENIDELLREIEAKENDEACAVWSFLTPLKYNDYIEKAIGILGENRGEAFGELCKRLCSSVGAGELEK